MTFPLTQRRAFDVVTGAVMLRTECTMNTFEHHLFTDWSACMTLLSQGDLAEVDRRLEALITLMERCQDRTWLAGPC